MFLLAALQVYSKRIEDVDKCKAEDPYTKFRMIRDMLAAGAEAEVDEGDTADKELVVPVTPRPLRDQPKVGFPFLQICFCFSVD